jgi:hypothetical protein
VGRLQGRVRVGARAGWVSVLVRAALVGSNLWDIRPAQGVGGVTGVGSCSAGWAWARAQGLGWAGCRQGWAGELLSWGAPDLGCEQLLARLRGHGGVLEGEHGVAKRHRLLACQGLQRRRQRVLLNLQGGGRANE